MTNCILHGRFCKTPELKSTPNGTAIVHFSLAVSGGKDEVDYIDCTAFDRLAEIICAYKKKGDLVAVAGRIKHDKWKTKEGKSFSKVYVLVNECEFLTTQASTPVEAKEQQEEWNNEELPF